jgi:hypothetical protein
MKSGTWTLKAVMIAAGAALCLGAGWGWPTATLWYAKRVAMKPYEKMQPSELATVNCVLAREVKTIPQAPPTEKTVQWVGDGYRVQFPADEFRRQTEPNDPYADHTFVGHKVKVRVLGVASKTPNFKAGTTPRNAEVTRYFGQTDPYQVLVDAFSVKTTDLAAADSHAVLQKKLYLMLLKTVLETIGCEKRWERFEVGQRKGIISGDTTCRSVIVDLYCPQTKEFAGLAVFPTAGATMDDVYQCLGQIRIEHDPAATCPVPFLAASKPGG